MNFNFNFIVKNKIRLRSLKYFGRKSDSRGAHAPSRAVVGALAGHILLLVFLAGCAVGPNYKAPKTPVNSAFENGGQTNLSTKETAIAWWQGFNDPELTNLVARALASNYDLRIATANLRESRALRNNAAFDLLPTVDGVASYTDTQYSRAFVPVTSAPPAGSTNTTAVSSSRHLELYNAGFDATWELDIFGHVRRSVEAAGDEVQSAVASRRDVMVSVISEVARNYFELLGAQSELATAEQNAENQRQTLKITEDTRDAGRGTELDVARARAQMNNTLADIPPLQSAVAHAQHRLSVLTGQLPEALTTELKEPRPLPDMPSVINIGSPEALLRRRSDIRAAERALAAATARIGIATADLFPRVTFNGNIALEATRFSGLPKGGADTWSFGPSITWAALDYGHVRARMVAAGAQADAQLAMYQRIVLTSLEETENALVDFSRQQARRDFLRESESASRSAAALARQRFENGATDFLTVLDAERVLFEAQDQLAQSNTRTATALVALYKSLGGGWEIELKPGKKVN
jgi:multidrug efflux system outer membrane protein